MVQNESTINDQGSRHLLWEQRVAGSNPVIPKVFKDKQIHHLYDSSQEDIKIDRNTPCRDGSDDMRSNTKSRKSNAKNLHPLPLNVNPLPLDKHSFSVQEAALVLGISTDSVIRYCKRGILLGQRVAYGKKQTFLIPRQAILIYLQEQSQKQQLVQEIHQPKLTTKDQRSHSFYMNKFTKSMEAGLINGRPFSRRTIDDYSYYLNLYFKQYEEVSVENLESELLKIPAEQKAKKVHYYKAMLCFSKFLVGKRVLEESVVQEIRKLKPKENKNPKRHVITIDEVIKLENICKTIEEKFLLRLLVSTGIRAAEACALNWVDIDIKKTIINIEKGKGDKRREVAIPPKALDVFSAYYTYRTPESLDTPVLINRDGNRMTNRGIHDRLQRLGNKAGIKNVHPHALRRAFVTINANRGIPLKVLQESCGHSDLKTTSDYCRTSKEEALQIMRSVDW